MKKSLDITAITNELREASVFFRREPTPAPDRQTSGGEPPVYKSTNQQVHKSTSGQVDLSTSGQADTVAGGLAARPVRRFTTYLTDESIKAMKRLALESDKKDYELFQEAVDKYLKKKGY